MNLRIFTAHFGWRFARRHRCLQPGGRAGERPAGAAASGGTGHRGLEPPPRRRHDSRRRLISPCGWRHLRCRGNIAAIHRAGGPAALSFTTIVFDLDGTLIDSAPDLQALLEPTLRSGGRRPLSIEETQQCIGWGMVKLVERAFALTGPPLDPASHDTVIAEFKARYEA